MKVLVVGGGGREHALCWKLSKSDKVTKVFAAPGNAGTALIGDNVNIDADDIKRLKEFAARESIDLTVVGPEVPLTAGIVDEFQKAGLKIFGPTKKAAELEGSKAFCKDLMAKYRIPTAEYRVFTTRDSAVAYLEDHSGGVVVKADGLAAGKGVIVCRDSEEAIKAVNYILEEGAFGSAGNRVVIEDFLEGEEASFIAVTDGKTVVPMATSQDHKAVYDGDKGPNTGGMGAYSPAPILTKALEDEVISTVIVPIIHAMEEEGRPFRGVLYAGLMIDSSKGKPSIKVLEFNCRFGDPEAQPILMRMKGDLFDLLLAASEGRLDEVDIGWDDNAAVCVVMASGGYPGDFEKGRVIEGLEDAGGGDDLVVFHGGTKAAGGNIVNSGGRVLGVTALGGSIKEAIERSYEGVERIHWPDVYYRKDIGAKAL